jgi:alpha-glucosidase
VQTWVPVNPNYSRGINVADQQNNPGSLWSFYKELLHVRRQSPALMSGSYEPLHEASNDYFAFLRSSQESGQSCLVVLNFSDTSQKIEFDLDSKKACCLFSSHKPAGETSSLRELSIEPFEVYIGELVSQELQSAA